MWKTQKQHEERVSVLNKSDPIRGSGGIVITTEDTAQDLLMLILPDFDIHTESKMEGSVDYERVYAHVRNTEMDKIDMIPGKTKIEWNGNTYIVHSIIDYTTKYLFKNAEIEMRRRLDTY